MKKWLMIAVVAALLIATVAVGMVIYNNKSTEQSATKNIATTDSSPSPTPSSTTTTDGRYINYSQSELSNKNYDVTILFFHAPWCIECRGFDAAIKEGSLPKNVQILKVDYDSSVDLRKKYSVTIQSTFVRVDSSGNKQASWVGYGKDKTVDTIVQNTK